MTRYSPPDFFEAAEQWGANCGPGALAAVLGMTLEQVRPHLGDFETKGYTNPTLMLRALSSLGVSWHTPNDLARPRHGLVRVQWEGPWTAPGVPIRARYRQTHWIGMRHENDEWLVFDVNAIYDDQAGRSCDGWIPYAMWSDKLVPWLLSECHPKANGRFHFTHRLEIKP